MREQRGYRGCILVLDRDCGNVQVSYLPCLPLGKSSLDLIPLVLLFLNLHRVQTRREGSDGDDSDGREQRRVRQVCGLFVVSVVVRL